MRAATWIIIIVVLLAVAGIWWWQRPSAGSRDTKEKPLGLKLKPSMAMASMNITDIDADRIKVTSKVILNNPYPIELKTNRVDYEIFIDSFKVIKSSYEKPISIKSRDSTVLELPLSILTKPMKEVLQHFEKTKQDSADYSVKANFEVDVPLAGERNFDININKRLPAVRVPKMQPGKIDIDKLGLHESKLGMVMHITNPNQFPLKMKDGRYTVVVDKNLKMEGVMEKIVNIPAKGSSDVAMDLDIKTGNMGKLAWKMLFEKKDTDFKLDFRCKLLTDIKMLNNSNMAMTASGTLEELKQLKEK